MARYTFRTECFGDGDRVPALLEELSVSLVSSKQQVDLLNDRWVMHQFTVDSDLELEVLRKKMANIIDKDKRFTDMHRCAQTLALGDTPNEEWFKK